MVFRGDNFRDLTKKDWFYAKTIRYNANLPYHSIFHLCMSSFIVMTTKRPSLRIELSCQGQPSRYIRSNWRVYLWPKMQPVKHRSSV